MANRSRGNCFCMIRDRDRIWEKLKLSQDKEIYVTYAGPLVEKGYAVAFLRGVGT